jgi:hypothetical protein
MAADQRRAALVPIQESCHTKLWTRTVCGGDEVIAPEPNEQRAVAGRREGVRHGYTYQIEVYRGSVVPLPSGTKIASIVISERGPKGGYQSYRITLAPEDLRRFAQMCLEVADEVADWSRNP